MIKFDPARAVLPPRPYQVSGVNQLLARPRYGLFWQMRLGKSKVVVDAANVLFQAGELDAVVVVCPAQVKGVWLDSELGEITKHSPDAHEVIDYAGSKREDLMFKVLPTWVVTSFEFLRQQGTNGDLPKVERLLHVLKGKKWWLVVDEATAVGNWKSLQYRAAYQLSVEADRVTILDGTPVGNSPMEQYAKFSLLGKSVLGYQSFWQFRARHAVVKRVPWTRSGQVVGFKDQTVIDKKVKPYCEYLSQEGLDLPEKVRSFITVPLAPKTWRVYKEMRDDLVAELDQGTVTANHAAVKVLRLAQLCAGFIGGWGPEEAASDLGFKENYLLLAKSEPKEVSRETTDAFLEWLKLRLQERPDFRCVVWCRWRAEIERLKKMLYEVDNINIGVIYGNEKSPNFLHPDSLVPSTDAGVMVVQPQAAQYGVSFARADTAVFLSQDWNRVSRAQAEERVQAIGVRKSTYVVDVLVTGPNGERTVVHDALRAIREKEDVARRTVEAWRRVLTL